MATAVQMMPTAPHLTSSVGLLAMLEEDEKEVKAHALVKLSEVVSDFWAEISESLPDIESLYEDEDFPQRQLAALVASKVYYFLGEMGDSLVYALGAGTLFDVDEGSEFVDTLLAKAIDEYCSLFQKRADAAVAAEREGEMATEVTIDPKLIELVDRMIESALGRRSYQVVLGLALEARRLELAERVITLCDTAPGDHDFDSSTGAMLSYCFSLFSSVVVSREFRNKLLALMVRIYRSLASPDFLGLCRCLAHLGDAAAVAEVLKTLVESGARDSLLMAYQVAFDLVDNCTQSFLKTVLQLVQPPPAAPAPVPAAEVPAAEGESEAAPAPAPAEGAAASASTADEPEGTSSKAYANLRLILTAEAPIALTLDFLVRANKTDLAILNSMKKTAEHRNSLNHSAIVLAHSIMSAGTTADSFLRDNLEWLSRATNWAKFQATATLGVIHRGHVKQALQLLAPYLPQQGMSASPYSEGGALFALGIIHANNGSAIRGYLLEALRNAGTNEVVQHGCALGMGIAAMGTHDDELYEELKGVLFNDSAVAGEASALAMGLVMLGSGSPKAIEEMLGYAHDTSHEKILRGLALGIALVMYGREEESDGLVTTLLHDQDPILRYAAMYTIAFAYACTGSNAALRRLLHVAVSDVADDVRRAAVIAIGFVLAGTPAQCPRVVKLLAESYNPHVRYGSAFAVGISCAGSGSKEAIELLQPMLADSVDYVRQGALLAMSMVLMQSPDHKEDSKLSEHRKHLHKVVGDKHEDAMTKFGAIVATGLLDAGGRNVTISLLSKSASKVMPAIVGMGVFTHFWFWHPLILFVSLAFHPTAAVGLNQDLAMPQWRFKSNAPPSAFAYPPPMSAEKKEKTSVVMTAALSTSAKAAAKAAKAGEAAGSAEAMEVDKAEEERKALALEEGMRDAMLEELSALHTKGRVPAALRTELLGTEPAAGGEKPDKPPLANVVAKLQAAHAEGTLATAAYSALMAHRTGEGAEEAEAAFEILENPSRVLRLQERHVTLLPSSRYTPIAKGRASGIIMLSDTQPDETEELLPASVLLTPAAADEVEPDPPAPFEFEG